MTYSKSPRSKGKILRKIDLPVELKAFFGQRNKFIRGLPSYEQIEGRDPEDHNQNFDWTYGFPTPLQETCPVNNTNPDSYKNAQTRTKELLSLFFGINSGGIAEPIREYMLTGGTKPIRVSTHLEKQGRKVYVKLPSVERIIGLSLYNLISDHHPIDFLFSEYVFVEDSVPGRHIDEENIKYFQRLPKLPESIVRLAVQDRFLGLNDLDRTVDLPGRKNALVNLLVQSEGEAVAFDVDCAFSKNTTEYDLVQKARESGIDIPTDLEKRVERDEANRILHKIHVTSNKRYEGYIHLMERIDSLRTQLEQMGFKNPRKYFCEREKILIGKAA